MLSLGGERLPPYHPPPPHPPPPTKKKKKFWIITCTTIWVCHHYYGAFFAHLLILEYPDHHQNLISSSWYYPGPLHTISSQSVHNVLSDVVHRQTDKQTNATKNITSFAKEVTNKPMLPKTLEALREHRPTWPGQIIPPPKKKKKVWIITCTTI